LPSDREIRRLLPMDLVADVHARSRGTYGMLRIRAALRREQGMVVNKKLILSIMRELYESPSMIPSGQPSAIHHRAAT
jgi:hypothetical protein